jgi:hypothetical protein
MSQINLLTILQKILREGEGTPGCVNFSADERDFIGRYLQDSHIELHARALMIDGESRKVNEHFFVKGDMTDVFTLLQSMADKSPNMASILYTVGNYVSVEMARCPKCTLMHRYGEPCGNIHEWNFNNNQNEETTTTTPGTPG